GRTGFVFDGLPAAGGLAELKLNLDDDLAADNIAYAYLPDYRRPRVAVLSDNPFLLQAVAANDGIEPRKVAADTPLNSFDCVVVEGGIPDPVLQSARPCLAAIPADLAGWWPAAVNVKTPETTAVNQAHPINSYVNFADVHIESAPRREMPPWLQ